MNLANRSRCRKRFRLQISRYSITLTGSSFTLFSRPGPSLLRYISDAQLRSTMQGATKKREALNRFLKWTILCGEGIIAENSWHEQRKPIKYNQLVANCFIFHNLCSLIRLIPTLEERGESVPEDAIAAISPYLTEHMNRFGYFHPQLRQETALSSYGYGPWSQTSSRKPPDRQTSVPRHPAAQPSPAI